MWAGLNQKIKAEIYDNSKGRPEYKFGGPKTARARVRKGRTEEKHANLWRMRKTTGDLKSRQQGSVDKVKRHFVAYKGTNVRSITALLR